MVEMTDELRAFWNERAVRGDWFVSGYEEAMRCITDRTHLPEPYWETADEMFNAAPGEPDIWDQSGAELQIDDVRKLGFELLLLADLAEASLPGGKA